jgi:hypothetical protein
MAHTQRSRSAALALLALSRKANETPAPIPPRLLAHLRRWKDRKLIATCFVELQGKPAASVRGIQDGREPGQTPRQGHTAHPSTHSRDLADAARGVPIWEAAGFLAMSPEMLQDTYGHHHPTLPDSEVRLISMGQGRRWGSPV